VFKNFLNQFCDVAQVAIVHKYMLAKFESKKNLKHPFIL
jgi:hypothetical protein